MPPFCAEHGMHHRYYGEHDDMRDAAADWIAARLGVTS